MSNISAFWGKTRASVWVRVLIGIPIALGLLMGIAWIGLRVGALDRVPWPRVVTFEGDADAFVQCFERRADIARRDAGRFVTLFSDQPEGYDEVLVQTGGVLGQEGARTVDLLRSDGLFMLRDRHYLPEHSPLSQPMSKTDWFVALRCGQKAG